MLAGILLGGTGVGCQHVRLGPGARQERVLGAVLDDYTKRLRALDPATADSLTRAARPSFRIVRRWTAPPLLRSEFFIVEHVDRRRRDWYLVGLDARAMPLLLRSPVPREPQNWSVWLDQDLLNRMILEERVTVDDAANAYWLARIAATLPVAAAAPYVVGEPQTAPDADPVSEAVLRAALHDSLRSRVVQSADSYVVDVPVAYGDRPSLDVWRISVRRDGTVNRLAEKPISVSSAFFGRKEQ